MWSWTVKDVSRPAAIKPRITEQASTDGLLP